MRRTALIASFILLVAATVAVSAEGEKKNVTNKKCPVMNSAASEKFRTEYKGQYVYFCCQGCIGMFEKDPEKFVAKMPPEDQEAIKINDICPVTEEKITERTHFLEVEGRKVYFCCEGCSDMYKQKLAEKQPE